MKLVAFTLALCIFAGISAHPARTVGRDEVEIIPLEDQNREPVIDIAAGGGIGSGGGFFSSSPFDGFLESVSSMMVRMRQQMNDLLRRIHANTTTTDDNPFGFPKFPSINDLDLGKGNTTSVTKVIDGHKVVINETEYSSGGDNEHSFFKVRIIDVRPDSSEIDNTPNPNAEELTPKSSIEQLENSYENEIPKNSEVYSNIETFDDTDMDAGTSTKWDTMGSLETIDGNSLDSNLVPISLSNDIDVNEIMADAGAPTNPDAEVFLPSELNPKMEQAINPR